MSLIAFILDSFHTHNTMTTQDALYYDDHSQQLICRGAWNLANLPQLQTHMNNIVWPTTGTVTFEGSAISQMDSAGAWLLNTWQNTLKRKGLTVQLKALPEQCQLLLQLIQKDISKEKKATAQKIPVPKPGWLARVGKSTVIHLDELREFFSFIGSLAYEALRILRHPLHFRLSSIIAVIYRNGFLALPIIALLSFLIGVVLTYQMGLQLKNYGANIYIVDLLGIAILREFGPLLTAIMVAGRTGASFTAQLGMMKLNQEIDALDTMGVTSAELLLLPRIFGLVITLPLLTIWADAFGIIGGMVMANNMLNLTWYDFLLRFPNVVPLKTLIIGLGKTPIFALLISSIGCFQGVKVEGSADSLGRNTTRSVVLAIFFIIVADALFSIVFSKLKL